MDSTMAEQNHAMAQNSLNSEVLNPQKAREKDSQMPKDSAGKTTAALANIPAVPVSTENAKTFKELEASKFRRIPLWTTLVSYVVGFLWVTCLILQYDWMPKHGMTALFTGIFYAWGEFTMKSIPRPSMECWFWMACAVGIAVGIDLPVRYGLSSARLMEGWDYFILHIIAVYWVLCRSGKLIEKKTSAMLILDGLTGFIIAPIAGIPNRIKRLFFGLSDIRTQSSMVKNAAITAVCAVLALPILWLVGTLLGVADATFGVIWSSIGSSISELFSIDSKFAFRAIVGFFVSGFMFSLISSCILWEKPVFSSQKIARSLTSFRIVPAMGCMVILGSFISLYMLFFGVQGIHLVGAFGGIIPDGMTASAFARHGFFELCTVLAINFGLLLAVSKCSRSSIYEHTGLRLMSILLLSESVLLSVTAASKLMLYIDRFGFTTLRLLSIWAILVLTFGCIVSIISLYKKTTIIDKWIWFAAATFVPLCMF